MYERSDDDAAVVFFDRKDLAVRPLRFKAVVAERARNDMVKGSNAVCIILCTSDNQVSV